MNRFQRNDFNFNLHRYKKVLRTAFLGAVGMNT